MTLVYCWAHSRRKLHDISQKDGSEVAAEGLRRIAGTYKIESSIRGKTPEQLLVIRRAQSVPLVAAFRQWLTHQCSRISTKSRLDEKLAYIHGHWDGLQIFLTDGHFKMDTNPVDKTIRSITLSRKNALFADRDEGGHTWARMASRIETNRAEIRTALRHRLRWILVGCTSSSAANSDAVRSPLMVSSATPALKLAPWFLCASSSPDSAPVKTSRRQSVASVTVRFSGGSSECRWWQGYPCTKLGSRFSTNAAMPSF